MVPTSSGGQTQINLTIDETKALLEARNINWKTDNNGNIVAVDDANLNRYERRKAKFARGHKGS